MAMLKDTNTQKVMKLHKKLASRVIEWKEIQREVLGWAADFLSIESCNSLDKPKA